jgi:hypothetical protein
MTARTGRSAALSVAAILLCACSSPRASAAPPASSSPPAPLASRGPVLPLAPTSATAGQVVADGDLRVIVNGWTDLTTSHQAGQRFLVVDFSVVNAGSSQLAVFGMHGIWAVEDGGGSGLTPFFDTLGRDLKAGGILYPGERVRVTEAFALGTSSGPYSLTYTNDRLPAIAPLTVALASAPGIAEPPARIEGEATHQTASSANSVAAGSWNIGATVSSVIRPCQEAHSQVNCTRLPDDLVEVELAVDQRNTSGQALNATLEGMLWIEDATGRRFEGNSTELEPQGRPVQGGDQISYAADFLVWPPSTSLWLAFRFRHGEKGDDGSYILMPLPALAGV